MAVIERTQVIAETAAFVVFTKAGTLAANDFAGSCRVGSLAVDTTTPKLYMCTVTNGTTTATWASVGAQT